MSDPTFDNVKAIILAAKDLDERPRHLDSQERNILWDAKELLSKVLDDDLLIHMRGLREPRTEG